MAIKDQKRGSNKTKGALILKKCNGMLIAVPQLVTFILA